MKKAECSFRDLGKNALPDVQAIMDAPRSLGQGLILPFFSSQIRKS